MPGPVATYLARQPAPPPVFRGADTQAAAALREKVVSLEHRYRLGGRSLFLPWLDKTNICRAAPWQLETAFAAIRNHYVVKPALLQKLFAVSSLDLQAHPADERSQPDKDVADFCRYQFGQILTVRDIVLEALFPSMVLGRVVCELVWDGELWPRGRWKGKRLYRTLKAKAKAVARYDDFGNISHVEGPGADGKTHEWEPDGFLVLRNMPWFGDDGTSDFLAIYQPLWEMETIKALQNISLDKNTTGFILAKYGQDANQTTSVTDPATNVVTPIEDVLEPVVQGVKSRGWAIVPPGVTLELLSLATGSEANFQAAISDREQKIVLGIAGAFLQTLTAPGGSGDMRGDSQTQASTAQLFVWDAAASVCTELNRQAVPPLVRENFGDGADYPTLTLSGVNLSEMNQLADIYGKAVVAGVKPSRAAYAKATGVQLAADPGDELLPPTAGTPAAPLGQPGTSATFKFSDGSTFDFCGGPGSGTPGPCPSGTADKPAGPMTVAQADAWGQEHFGGWAKSLTPGEKFAINAYTGGGYESINAELRQGKTPAMTSGKTPEVIAGMDSALAKGAAPHALTVFRGVKGDYAESLVAAAQSGGEVSDPSFMSTTLSEKAVGKFARRKDLTNAVVRIEVPEGARGAYTDVVADTGEAEWVMPRGMKLQLSGAKQRDDGVWELTAKVAGPHKFADSGAKKKLTAVPTRSTLGSTPPAGSPGPT
jgi:hypothetical protein